MPSFFASIATTLQLQAPFTALMALILYRLWRTYRLPPMRDLAIGWGLWTTRMIVVSYSAALRAMGTPSSSLDRRLLSMLGVGVALGTLPYLVSGMLSLSKGGKTVYSPGRWALWLAAVFMPLSFFSTSATSPNVLRLALLMFSSTVSFAIAFGFVAWGLLREKEDELTSARQLASLGFGAYALKQWWNLAAFVQAGPPEAAASAATENIVLIMVAMGSIVLLFDWLRQRSVLAEREQRRLEAELAARDHLDSIGRLAGGVAHDFNNMLTTILGNAQLARMRIADGEACREELGEIESTATRASALTKQLLTFARRERVRPVPVDLVARVRAMQRYLLRQVAPQARLTFHLADDVPLVLADPERVEQALVNLVINASDALPDGRGEIAVHVAAAPGMLRGADAVRMTVEDNGSGMDVSIQARLFEPFFTTKGLERGTGLGLSIVHGAVMQANGDIRVESTPGKGARFELLLPVSPGGGTAALDPSLSITTGEFSNVRALVVDDDLLVRRVAVRLLQKKGFGVLEAGDAEEALRLHQQQDTPVQLLLTDIVMPGDNGRTLARLLRARDPQLAVVYMSGYEADAFTDEPDAPEAPFVAKPFSEAQLISAMKLALSAVRTRPLIP